MKQLFRILIMGLVMLVITACGSSDNTDNEESENVEEDEMLTIKHELGETEVEKNPEKVVVFDFGTLDSLDKLGIEVEGVPQNIIPSYLEKFGGDDYENVGSLKEPDFEKISEIDPDLILISGRQSDQYDELSELAPTIYTGVDTTRYMESFKENVEKIGKIFDKEEEVDQELSAIDDSIEEVQDKASEADKNALIILANEDKISAYGPESRFGLIHDVFGVPAVDDDIEVAVHGKNVSFEYVTEKDPDILYVIDRNAAIGEGSSAKQTVENELMEKTTAYQNDDIVYLDPEFWYLSGGGLTSVSEMLNEVKDSLE